jgi:hypothetical protein
MNEALIARWNGFLEQIKGRFQIILQEAKDGCAGLLVESNLDPIPMTNAWGAMERRAKDLGTKIEETWNDQVEKKFAEVNAPPALVAAERRKGLEARRAMDIEVERTRIDIYVDAARRISDAARAEMAEGFKCKQCGAVVEVPITFRAVNVKCKFCSAVSTFEPGTRTRMMEASCLHPLCQDRAWNEWVAMTKADHALHDARGYPLNLLVAYETAQIAYWRAYLTARLTWLPDQAGSFEKDLRGRMAHWYERMENEKEWVAAGRPRQLR